jgi:hypothetical protein
MYKVTVCLASSAAIFMLALSAAAEDKKIPADQIPASVMKAVKARLPGVVVRSAEEEIENGVTVYDLELTCQGRKYEMDVKPDGTIMELEKEVAARDLPQVVQTALAAKYPKATYKEIMEVNKVEGKTETPFEYEVNLVTADNKKMEVTVSLDGKKVKGGKAEGDKD